MSICSICNYSTDNEYNFVKHKCKGVTGFQCDNCKKYYKNKVSLDKHKKQICVYGFTKQALEVFSSRTKTLNEQYEDIEILNNIIKEHIDLTKETQLPLL